jgi:hypothetical protein
LAQRYKALKIQASMPIDSREAVDRERLLKERREAVNAIEACIDEIRRTVPGQKRFLLGPTIEEIKMHAVEGPIVIVNVTDIASDAIIVSHSQVKSLPLPGLSPDTAPHHIQHQFRQYLSNRRGDYYDRDIGGDDSDSDSDDVEADQLMWLWSNCVKLVLDELAAMGLASAEGGDPPSRVWWMGSGIASSFPFHAAGIASEGALNRTVSSYTPTIKALGYSRAKAATAAVDAKADDDSDNEKDNNVNNKSTILVVTMSTTPGHKPLKGARREHSVIEAAAAAASAAAAAAAGSSTTNTASSSPYSICTVQELLQPSVRSVLAQIPRSDIVHFAYHGFSDPKDPSRSHLLLQRNSGDDDDGNDGGGGGRGGPIVDRLTIARLAKAVAAQPATSSAGGARIAFLSACSTAEVKARELGDEGLHLASAFQVAGFASVVGSLWAVDDEVCIALAEGFYRRLLRGEEKGGKGSGKEGVKGKVEEGLGNSGRVAEALRYAVMRLRARYPESPFAWTPFVHFGA